MTHRLQIHRDLVHYPGSAIQDRSVYEDAEIFAQNLYLQGNLSDRDWSTYRALIPDAYPNSCRRPTW